MIQSLTARLPAREQLLGGLRCAVFVCLTRPGLCVWWQGDWEDTK